MLQKALDLARMDVSCMNVNEHQVNNNNLDSMSHDPTVEERRNAVVDLMVNIPLDLSNATTVKAAIRNNLAHALGRIEQPISLSNSLNIL